MHNTLLHTQRILLSVFIYIIVGAAVMVILFESNDVWTGIAAGLDPTEFLLTATMELLTIAGIPLALRLFKMERVAGSLGQGGPRALLAWGLLRLSILLLLIHLNTLFYYLFLNTTFGYLAIITALCLPFVCPTIARCEEELQS